MERYPTESLQKNIREVKIAKRIIFYINNLKSTLSLLKNTDILSNQAKQGECNGEMLSLY